MRIAGVRTLEQANGYLEEEFVPWWNQHLTVPPANSTDTHRPLGPEQDLASALSHVETRQVASDYTIRCAGTVYQIARGSVVAGLRGSPVRVEWWLDGSVADRFREHVLAISLCSASSRPAVKTASAPRRSQTPKKAGAESWGQIDLRKGLPVWIAGTIG